MRLGSLSTILAGFLILAALLSVLMIIAGSMNFLLNLNHDLSRYMVSIGDTEARYAGLIMRGYLVESTRGPVTFVGLVLPNGDYLAINITGYSLSLGSGGLLLTDAGPILVDPVAESSPNSYLLPNHWVRLSTVSSGWYGLGWYWFDGVILNLTGNYFLLSPPGSYSSSIWGGSIQWSGYFKKFTLLGPISVGTSHVDVDHGLGYFGCYNTPMLYCPPPPSGVSTPIPQEPFSGNMSITVVNSTTVMLIIRVPQMEKDVGGLGLQFLAGQQFLDPTCSWPNAPRGWSAWEGPTQSCQFYWYGGPVGPIYVNFGSRGVPRDYYVLFMTYPYDKYAGTRFTWPFTNPPSGEYWYAWHVINGQVSAAEFLTYQYQPTPIK